jgi:hypothetical protein
MAYYVDEETKALRMVPKGDVLTGPMSPTGR